MNRRGFLGFLGMGSVAAPALAAAAAPSPVAARYMRVGTVGMTMDPVSGRAILTLDAERVTFEAPVEIRTGQPSFYYDVGGRIIIAHTSNGGERFFVEDRQDGIAVHRALPASEFSIGGQAFNFDAYLAEYGPPQPALLVQEASARASAETAQATRITTLNATVDRPFTGLRFAPD